MERQNNFLKKLNRKNSYAVHLIFSLAFALSFLYSCKKEKTVDTTAPSYKIAESEKLTIPIEVELPANLPGGNTRTATYYAEGVQKYKAQAKAGSSPIVYEWVFVAPKADLYDATNKKVGTHGAGPYWVLSPVDSIFAQQFTPVKSVTPDANSIPWLQLMPKAGKVPTGAFSNVNYIQRIATRGGKAPATAPASATDTVDVLYTAVYRFAKKN